MMSSIVKEPTTVMKLVQTCMRSVDREALTVSIS